MHRDLNIQTNKSLATA